MKRVLLFAILPVFAAIAQAQIDTLGKSPFIFIHDFPIDSVNGDSIHCELRWSFSHYGDHDAPSTFHWTPGLKDYAVYMHTDDTLTITGVAYNTIYDNRYHPEVFTIYDTNMTALASVYSSYHYSAAGWIAGDSLSISRWHAGNPPTAQNSDYIPVFLLGVPSTSSTMPIFRTDFFADSAIQVIGDFYLGVAQFYYMAQTFSGIVYQQTPSFCRFLYENHEPPYHFGPRRYRIYIDTDTLKGWQDMLSERSIPMLFPIVEPKCGCVDTVRLEADSAGCLVAEWDTLPRQRQWAVELRRNGQSLGAPDTVDTCRWQRCGLQPGAGYTVAVRSRCTNLGTYSWSPWRASGAEQVPEPVGIDPEATLRGLTLTPNPTRGGATLRLPQPLPSDARLVLRDAQGRLLHSLTLPAGSARAAVPTEGLAPGVYMLTVSTPHHTATLRLVRHR